MANRQALVARFAVRQAVFQTDPWAEPATPAGCPRWRALADLRMAQGADEGAVRSHAVRVKAGRVWLDAADLPRAAATA